MYFVLYKSSENLLYIIILMKFVIVFSMADRGPFGDAFLTLSEWFPFL